MGWVPVSKGSKKPAPWKGGPALGPPGGLAEVLAPSTQHLAERRKNGRGPRHLSGRNKAAVSLTQSPPSLLSLLTSLPSPFPSLFPRALSFSTSSSRSSCLTLFSSPPCLLTCSPLLSSPGQFLLSSNRLHVVVSGALPQQPWHLARIPPNYDTLGKFQ